MKRMLWVITVLLLCLAACGDGVAEKATPSPVAGEKIVGDAAVLFPSSTDEPVAGEKSFEAAGPTPTPAGDPVAGGKTFASACAACHGQDMIQNEFIATKTNQELVEFIKLGGVPNEALVMPPRGGNPSLTDEKLDDIAAYLRSLQK
jgi:mono/diheme cytochrome c family protein